VFSHLASALRRTLRIAGERPRPALWTLLALTSAMFAVGIAAVAAVTSIAGRNAPPRRQHGGLPRDGVDDARARALLVELQALHGVEHAELIPPVESARRLQQALGADTALLDGVDLGSLPSSLEVTLGAGRPRRRCDESDRARAAWSAGSR